ncbi:hypothetical protein MUK42_03350 [Musa troglodytarum]|uniref:Uncharacterized protein n=1 Tax=Musa troglodytarum TaxID=320322 RepID=A0A9E7K2L1_9LILI|nr:hypothetical protein MUK42_03350 [Musa troglodytarum]
MVIKFAQIQCLNDFLLTISKIQNIDHSPYILGLEKLVQP